MGYIRKALEKGYLEHPGSACCTDDMFEIFVRHGKHLAKNGPLFRPKTGPFEAKQFLCGCRHFHTLVRWTLA